MAAKKKETTDALQMSDLLDRSVKQLVQLRNELRKQLFDHKLSLALRKLNQPHLIRTTRKAIARVQTALKKK